MDTCQFQGKVKKIIRDGIGLYKIIMEIPGEYNPMYPWMLEREICWPDRIDLPKVGVSITVNGNYYCGAFVANEMVHESHLPLELSDTTKPLIHDPEKHYPITSWGTNSTYGATIYADGCRDQCSGN